MRNIFVFLMVLLLAACAGKHPDGLSVGETSVSDSVHGEHLVHDKISFNLRVKSTKEAKPMVHKKTEDFKGHIDSEIGSSIVAYIPSKSLNDFISALNSDVGKVKGIKKSNTQLEEKSEEQKAGYSYIYIWLDDRSAVVRTLMTPLASIFDL